MIRKADLIEAINDLSHDLFALSVRVKEVEKKCDAISKNREVKVVSKKASKQPRDKSGKFAKKK